MTNTSYYFYMHALIKSSANMVANLSATIWRPISFVGLP